MIKHVVCLNFKDGTVEAEIADLEASLKRLPEIIIEVKSYEFGRDVVHSERSYDFALVSSFDDLEALKRYQVHPEHQLVLEKIKQFCKHILTVDFESENI
ncbi:Dabb family protein [Candidatus Magnetomoraceae bacterium gMMP-15]